MAEAMRVDGYVGTPVAAVIKRAGVSRETFYQHYDSKLDCFLAAFDLVADLLLARLSDGIGGEGDPMQRFERALAIYLNSLAAEIGYARLFLVEVYAAGPEAMARRADVQGRLVDAIARNFGARTRTARFSCQVIVAALATMVTGPLVAEDPKALRALGSPIIAHVQALVEAGELGR
jgi:AcrR family transcriptional regulator